VSTEGQDQFQPVNRRAGYGDALYWALRQARKGGTLMAGEGLLLVEHFEAMVKAAYEEAEYAFTGDTGTWDTSDTKRRMEAPHGD
jgi:hypothetical protein